MKLLFRELHPEDGDENPRGLAFPQGEWRHCWPFTTGVGGVDPTFALSVSVFSALQSSMPKVLTLKKKFTSKSFRDRTWRVCETSPSGLLILPASLTSYGCCSHLTFLLGR